MKNIKSFLFSTVNLYYALNFLLFIFTCYRPQYYLQEIFQDPLPLSFIGKFFYGRPPAQYTKIDCFPGHTGIAVLISWWLGFIKHSHFKWCLFLTSIMLATIGLRYHYTLDLLAAIPVAILSFYLGVRIFPEKD